jgi:hypothetical protein
MLAKDLLISEGKNINTKEDFKTLIELQSLFELFYEKKISQEFVLEKASYLLKNDTL